MKILKLLICFLLVFVFLSVSKAQDNSAGDNINTEKITKRVGSIIGLKPEYEERYLILYRNIFPGVVERIKKSNLSDFSIFLKNGILFMYYEYTGSDYDADIAAIADPITKDWRKLTDPMQQPIPTKKENEWWAATYKLFSLEKKLKSSAGAQRIALAAEVIPGKEAELRKFCEKFPVELEKVTNEKEFQNCTLFLRDGHLYYYYEYVGNNIRESLREVTQTDEFQNFQQQMNTYLIPKGNDHWDIMEEVLHIN